MINEIIAYLLQNISVKCWK